jgi:glucose uptake protein GlcU
MSRALYQLGYPARRHGLSRNSFAPANVTEGDVKRYGGDVIHSATGEEQKPPQPMSSIAILLIPVGVFFGTLAALVAFYVNSEVGLNAQYPLNITGLLVSVFFGFFVSLIVTSVGLVALVVSSHLLPHRVASAVLGVAIGCLVGGLAGSLVIRGGLDSWAEAIFESEIVGVSEAVLLAVIVGIRQAVDSRRTTALG